jgi:hypothetical protein
LAVLTLTGLPLTACSGHDAPKAKAEQPAEVAKIEGSEISRVTLTEDAMRRIDLKTTAVREQQLDGATRRAVPYSSLIYDPSGRTWVYTSPQRRIFVRQQVDVDRIEGDWVLLNDGPAPGTEVASLGVAQLYGAETGVGH